MRLTAAQDVDRVHLVATLWAGKRASMGSSASTQWPAPRGTGHRTIVETKSERGGEPRKPKRADDPPPVVPLLLAEAADQRAGGRDDAAQRIRVDGRRGDRRATPSPL